MLPIRWNTPITLNTKFAPLPPPTKIYQTPRRPTPSPSAYFTITYTRLINGGSRGIQGVRFELKLFHFHEEFSEKLSDKVNESPLPSMKIWTPIKKSRIRTCFTCLAGTHRWLNIESTLIRPHTLNQCWVKAMCLLGDHRYILRKSKGNGITARILRFIEVLQHTSGTNQEKGHSASLLSHVQPEQAGLDKKKLESKILSTCLKIYSSK